MTDLSAGDLALIGYSADSTGPNFKGFSFVLLKSVDAGTVINFTDNGWKAAGGFTTTEGVLTYTAPTGGAAAGTVIDFTGQTGTFNLSTSGDSVIAYQGTAAAPTALFALHIANDKTAFDADATNSNTSAVPTGLTFGATALAFGPDNAAYTGPTTGTAAQLLANIDNSANWTTSDTTSVAYDTGFTVTGGGSPPPPPPPPTPTVSIADVSHAEGAADNTMSFTVTRSDTSTAFTVDYATHDGSATGGSDYTAATGTLTFAAGGPATQTIDITVHGDTAVEPDENFSLTLGNVVNATGGTVLGTASATGTIVNDDTSAVPISGPVFINEFHYDNSGTDAGEFIEIAAPVGADLTGYKLELYDGNGAKLYTSSTNTIALTGPASGGEHGEDMISVSLPVNGLQNGGSAAAPQPDGIALVDPTGHVVEFISYEGVMTATNGDAAGITSTDVGVSEDGTQSGTSIARVGLGVDAGDFTWTLSNTATPGAENTGETFLAPSPRIHISDPSVTEGDTGTATLTFTVTRTGTPDAFTVDYATSDGTATHGSDYQPASGTLSFAAGETSKTVSVTVNGDTAVEGNETVNLNLANATGGAVIIDAQGKGAIVNDDVALVHTYDIQGASQHSPLDGQHVFTEGVVTAIDTTGSQGFWIQDATGDGDDATSDAVFVFTGAPPTVQVGHLVKVEGDVDEFQGSDTNNLSITEVVSGAGHITDEGAGPTIAATVIGDGGRHAPTEVIDDNNFATFDPTHNAADFYESLEGMLVTVKNAQAVDSTFSNETFVVPDNGTSSTGMNDRGGITIGPNDMNPERIEIFNDSGVSNVTLNNVTGDHLGDVTGVLSYFGGNYELLPLTVGSTATAGLAPREGPSSLVGDASHLTIGEYNLENIDPTDPDSKFAALASDIVHNLNAPDIMGLEEIQDADGAGGGSDLSGTATLTKLVNAIAAAGGPHYAFAEIAPTANNANGGEPNGNIRQAFLYDPTKVSLVDGSLRQITDDNPANGDAYDNSRRPLVGDFTFNGEKVTVVDVHNYARSGSDELYGLDQPPINSGDDRRTDQTTPVEHFVQNQEAGDPNAHIVVTGDFNGFQFETAQTVLETGGILTNLDNQLAATDRYSFSFEGNMEQIDQMYASPSLTGSAQFDIVHLNTGQPDSRPTDHDPTLGRFLINTAPTAVNDAAAANDHQSVTLDVLANDTDINTSDTRTLVSVSATSAGGHAAIVNGQVVYTADADAFDALTPGQHATDSFTYLMKDAAGATSSATVSVTVNGIAAGPNQTGDAGDNSMTGTVGNEKIDGGAGNDTIDAGSGADVVVGGIGNDMMLGGAGADSLTAGDGNDTLVGGTGNDTMGGARGTDLFVFGQNFGHDVVADFLPGTDHISFQGTGFTSFADVTSHAAQSGPNLMITDAAGDTLQLTNVQLSSLHAADFVFA